MCMTGDSKSVVKPESNPVRVLSRAQVAGYDATVLAADSVDGLYRWLAERKYPVSPALKQRVHDASAAGIG